MTSRRRILALVGFSLLGLLLAGGFWFASLFFLPREAAALRDGVLAGRAAKTQVQLNLGWASTSLVRAFVSHLSGVDANAREALKAVRAVAVGVYRLKGPAGTSGLQATIDRSMARRGWQRVLLVSKHGQNVVGYTPVDSSGTSLSLCLAVEENGTLVVVSARLNSTELAALAARQMPTPCDMARGI